MCDRPKYIGEAFLSLNLPAIDPPGEALTNTEFFRRLARRLEPYDPLWFEEPVPPEDIEGYLEVKRNTSLLIAGGAALLAFAFLKTGGFFGIGDYELQIQALNAYFRENIWFYFYDFEYDGSIDREDVPQIPILIPNISFTLTF